MNHKKWYLKKSEKGWWISNQEEYLHEDGKIDCYAYYFSTIDEAMKSLHQYAVENNIKDSCFEMHNIFVNLQTSYWS